MNRFLSTAIVASVFKSSPALASMAKSMAARKTPLEPFDAMDPNRKLAPEESPWLSESKGGDAGKQLSIEDEILSKRFARVETVARNNLAKRLRSRRHA
jgi:hypothetical protein